MGRRARSIQANVGSPESVKELFDEFSHTFDRLDILVSSAASGVLKPALEMTASIGDGVWRPTPWHLICSPRAWLH